MHKGQDQVNIVEVYQMMVIGSFSSIMKYSYYLVNTSISCWLVFVIGITNCTDLKTGLPLNPLNESSNN